MDKPGAAESARAGKSSSHEASPAPGGDPEAIPNSSAENPAPRAVVGIGASAGGLDALLRLLARLTPDTGLAFVIAQHLAPTHETLLPEILQRATTIPVVLAEDGALIEADHAYVIPPGALMTVTDGHLKVVRRERIRGVHTLVDSFFKSLAEVHGSEAIGVILSGAGSDGSHGIEAIKEVGGITIAQDSESAQFPSMPEQAARTGCIDFVLPPERIADHLIELSRHAVPGGSAKSDESDALKVLLLLRQRSGVDFRHYRRATVHRRIMRRMLAHRAQTHGEYLAHVQKNPQELDALYADLLIGVTRFFRDPESFALLHSDGFPAMLKDRPPNDGPVRVWVAGCSGGEETYTVAMLLQEFLGDRAGDTDIQIFATDLSGASITRARAALYPETVEADVSPERLARFFVHEDGGYRIKRSTRDLCVFATHNVAKDPPFSQLDLIVCRNVLIYFDTKLQDAVMPTFHYALKPSGLLMLGSAESASAEHFKAFDKRHRIFRPKARTQTSARAAELPLMPMESAPSKRPLVPGTRRGQPQADVPHHDADRVALTRFAPPGVLVNERLDVVQLRGDTTGLLRLMPGAASLHLYKIAHPDLLAPLRTAVDAARNTMARAREENVMLREGDVLRSLAIEVLPFQSGPDAEQFFLVAFENAGAEVPAPDDTRSLLSVDRSKKGKKLPRRAPLIEELGQLRDQLTTARAHLQDVVEQYEATNEELRAASEEIQSTNEELQSSNEELETTKEEVQSTNEELMTVNEELRHRNQDLAATSADLANVFASTQIPIMIVAGDMTIRRFTPATDRVARVIPSDIGRPLMDVKLRVECPNLEAFVTDAIESLAITNADVKDDDGKWWSLTVRPYLTIDRKVDGAVLVFTDIDVSKRFGADAEETAESRRVMLVAAESARGEAVEANRVKTSFMANISHDLRTPLNAIAGYVDLMELEVHGVLTADQHQDLQRIKQSSRHLISLINDILNFAQLESGRLEFHLTKVPVKRALARLEEMLHPQLTAKGLSFRYDAPDVTCVADEDRLQQILANLATNAIKFTDVGEIVISAEVDKAWVRIHVRDTGRGIAGDHLRRVFEPFIQVGRGLTNMNAEGVGLGLAIARDLARRMAGDVTVVSTLGAGSTFTLSLPREFVAG